MQNIIRSINLSGGSVLTLAPGLARKESIAINLLEHLSENNSVHTRAVCDKICDEVCDKVCDNVCDVICGEICDKVCDEVCDAICDANGDGGGGNPCDSNQQCSCICEIDG